VVVSEERGNISFCFNGNIASNLDGPKLRTMLEAVFSPKSVRKRSAKMRRSATATPLPVSVVDTRRDPEEGSTTVARNEVTPAALPRLRGNAEGEALPSVRPKPLIEKTEDTLRTHRESEPPRLRKGGESEHPAPLRTRPGFDDLLPKIPKPGKLPIMLPRVVMPVRPGEALATPIGPEPAPAASADSRSREKESKANETASSGRAGEAKPGAKRGGDKP